MYYLIWAILLLLSVVTVWPDKLLQSPRDPQPGDVLFSSFPTLRSFPPLSPLIGKVCEVYTDHSNRYPHQQSKLWIELWVATISRDQRLSRPRVWKI